MVVRWGWLAVLGVLSAAGSASFLGSPSESTPRLVIGADSGTRGPGEITVEYAPPASIGPGVWLGAQALNRSTVSIGDPAAGFPPARALEAYRRADLVLDAAAPACHLSWTLVAAVGSIESDHGRAGGSEVSSDGVTRPAIVGPRLDGKGAVGLVVDTDLGRLDGDQEVDRAVGPMQFIPSTWAVVAVDGDGDGVRDPQDIDDAALAAAVFLCAWHDDLATDAGRRSALFRYNRSTSYADRVLAAMAGYDAAARGTTPVTITDTTTDTVAASAGLASVTEQPALEQVLEVVVGQIWGIPSQWEPPPPAGWGEWSPPPAPTPITAATDTHDNTARPPEPTASAPTPAPGAAPLPAPTETPIPTATAEPMVPPAEEAPTSSTDDGPVEQVGSSSADPTAEELAAWWACLAQLAPVSDPVGDPVEDVASGECLAAALGLPSDDPRLVWLLTRMPSRQPE